MGYMNNTLYDTKTCMKKPLVYEEKRNKNMCYR